MKNPLKVLWLLFVSASLSWSSNSQTPATGSIAGTVQDNTAAVTIGAIVTVKNDTGTVQTGATGENGAYTILGVPPGKYSVTVSLSGFKDFHAMDVVVRVGETTRIDATLSPASVSTQVKVEGESVTQIETESSQISGTITSKEIILTGLNGRNFTQLVALAPGVSNQTGQDEAVVGVKGSVKYSVNGGRVEYNSYDVDGGDVLNASINGSSSTLIVYPSLDSIDELQVLTSNYGAMYGRSASGTILARTKAGTVNFHGDGYFFLRNNHLNARNFFDETAHAPLYQKYDPGFTLGGPLYIPGHYNTTKDKTFFFVSEEYRHERAPVDFNQGVPSLEERNCSSAKNVNPYCGNPSPQDQNKFYGDFSDVCPKVSPGIPGVAAGGEASFSRTPGIGLPYYPDCPALAPVGSGYLTFPGNLVPISSISEAILSTNLIPAPNSATGCNSSVGSCYDATVSPLTTWREDLFRIDHNFSSKEKIYFRYIHDAWSTVVLTPQWAVVHNSFPTVENSFVGPGLSLVAHFTSTISNRMVNDMAMAYTTDHIKITDIPGPGVSLSPPSALTASCNASNANNCGVGYIFNNGFGGKIPGIVIGGTNAAYGGKGFSVDPGYMPWRHSNPTYSPRDDATLALGKHTLEFGVLAIFAQRSEINPPVGANLGDVQGLATFSNTVTLRSTGNAFADFETPDIQSYQQDSAQGVYHESYKIAEPYLQDDWKITRRLTLNLGVRFSLFGMYHEKDLYSYNWVPSQFSSSLASEITVNKQWGYLQYSATQQAVPIDLNNLAPVLTNGLVRCGVDKYSNGTPVPASCMSGHLFNPAPRIGFAWDPRGNGKISVRGGYGIFFEHGTGNEANTGSLEGSPGNSSAGGVLDMTQYYPESWQCIGNVAPAGCPAVQGAFPLNLTSIPTKVQWPYVQQWSLSIQRELTWHFLGTVAYVGSKGTHLSAELQINQLVPVNASQNPFQQGQPITGDTCSNFGIDQPVNGVTITPGTPLYYNMEAACGGLDAFAAVPNALRQSGTAIAPGLGQIYSLQNIANSSYNALQMTLRRTEGPLTLGVSYSYSHSIDDSSDRTSAVFVNAYDISQNRASSDFDQRHLLNISYILQLPVLKLYKRFTTWADSDPTNQVRDQNGGSATAREKSFLDGWQLSGITTYQTGTPFSVLNGGSTNLISVPDNAGVAAVIGPGSYPDLATTLSTPNQEASQVGTIGPLLGNPSQFVAPEGLTYGNAGRNFLRNPSLFNFDISLLKDWRFGESRSLQFRLESFNTFNHTEFRIYDPANPGSTGNNIINCYGSTSYSAGDTSCLAGNSFLHPVDAHMPRTIQLGLKFSF